MVLINQLQGIQLRPEYRNPPVSLAYLFLKHLHDPWLFHTRLLRRRERIWLTMRPVLGQFPLHPVANQLRCDLRQRTPVVGRRVFVFEQLKPEYAGGSQGTRRVVGDRMAKRGACGFPVFKEADQGSGEMDLLTGRCFETGQSPSVQFTTESSESHGVLRCRNKEWR